MTFPPLAIAPDLQIVLTDGIAQALPRRSKELLLNPLQIEAKVLVWQQKNPNHLRLDDSEAWLESYGPTIEAYEREGYRKYDEAWRSENGGFILDGLKNSYLHEGLSEREADKKAVMLHSSLLGTPHMDFGTWRKTASEIL